MNHPSFTCLDQWAKSVELTNIQNVLDCYAQSAVLTPTVSNKIRQTPDQIKDYFESFLSKIDGAVSWDQTIVQEVRPDVVTWAGIYTFQLNSGPFTARFTFNVKKIGEDWKILHHHSSGLPE